MSLAPYDPEFSHVQVRPIAGSLGAEIRGLDIAGPLEPKLRAEILFPRELEEAAMIDGCSPIGTLWRIVLPVALPGLGATTLYAFILSWNEFAFARTLLTGNPGNWTVTVGLASIRGEYLTAWNEIMAAAVLIAAPIMAVFVWLERYLVAGLTAGAQR